MSTGKKPTPPQDLIEAAQTGDRLETLIALRNLLAEKLQNTDSGRDVASMSRRLMQCVSEIETLERIKKELEESPNHIATMRKRLINARRIMDSQYKINSISEEHEEH